METVGIRQGYISLLLDRKGYIDQADDSFVVELKDINVVRAYREYLDSLYISSVLDVNQKSGQVDPTYIVKVDRAYEGFLYINTSCLKIRIDGDLCSKADIVSHDFAIGWVSALVDTAFSIDRYLVLNTCDFYTKMRLAEMLILIGVHYKIYYLKSKGLYTIRIACKKDIQKLFSILRLNSTDKIIKLRLLSLSFKKSKYDKIKDLYDQGVPVKEACKILDVPKSQRSTFYKRLRAKGIPV